MINRARADPPAEGTRLRIDIKKGLPEEKKSLVGPRPPLAMNKTLLATARAHSKEMFEKNYFKHEDVDGRAPGERFREAGYDWTACGENISAGSQASLGELEDMLMVDKGLEGRPHRVNLLDLHTEFTFREIGIGGFSGAAVNEKGLKDFLTQDFGTRSDAPFILGVVYQDRNGNHLYNRGEGIAGVLVTPDRGDYYAVTSSAGGYAFPARDGGGTLKVTASGNGLSEPLMRTVSLNGSNAKVDFVIAAQSR
jgi:hypothetical protein